MAAQSRASAEDDTIKTFASWHFALLLKMRQDVFAPLFREVHVEKNEVQAGRIFISIRVVEELRGQKSVPHNAGVGIDMSSFNGLADEKHIAFIVLDHKNLARQFVLKIGA